MGLFSKSDADREYAEARQQLEEVSDDYLTANDRVAEAEQHVSWWKRGW